MTRGRWAIRVPDRLADKDLTSFFRVWRWSNNPGNDVVLDFSTADFIAPWAAAMFGAYGRWLQEVRGKTVELWVDDSSRAGEFLCRVGMPELIKGASCTTPSGKGAERLFPLTQVRESSAIQPCVSAVMSVLSIDDAEIADALKYTLVELLRNVVQHARSQIGAVVVAAYYPTAGIASVIVADMGCGVRVSLQDRYREIDNDYKAVKFALQPHVSGTFDSGAYQSMANNAGLGLFFIKEIVSLSGGGFFLASGTMMADLWGNADGSPGKQYITAKTAGWGGTVALLQLRRGKIAEFNGVLQVCRELAAAARKDASELKLDFIEAVPEVEGLRVVRVRAFEEDVEAAAVIRDSQIIPALDAGELVVLDFEGIRAATQSFAHALVYRVLRDARNVEMALSIAGADSATEEAIRAVAAYAKIQGSSKGA